MGSLKRALGGCTIILCFTGILSIVQGRQLMALAWPEVPIRVQVIETSEYPYNSKYGTNIRQHVSVLLSWNYGGNHHEAEYVVEKSRNAPFRNTMRINPGNPDDFSYYDVDWFVTGALGGLSVASIVGLLFQKPKNRRARN